MALTIALAFVAIYALFAFAVFLGQSIACHAAHRALWVALTWPASLRGGV